MHQADWLYNCTVCCCTLTMTGTEAAMQATSKVIFSVKDILYHLDIVLILLHDLILN